MKLFEASDGKGVTALVLDKKDGKLLVEMLEAAAKAHPRKSTFKTFKDKLVNGLACY